MVKIIMMSLLTVAHLASIYGLFILHEHRARIRLLVDLFLQYEIISMLGITIGVHRLWAHKTFKARLPLRVILMLCNSICNEGNIYWWCRDHIMHHKYSDTDADPYNSSRGLFFSHMGWAFMDKHPKLLDKSKEHNFTHLLDDPVVWFQYKLDPFLRHFMCFVLPTIYGHMVYGDWKIGLFVFGFLRWIATLHSTWTVNSFAHYSGTRNYNDNIKPSNNWIVSLLSGGEGWHNYHHCYPSDYTCAERHPLVEYNPSTIMIDLLALFGQVHERKLTKEKDCAISTAIIKQLMPLVNLHDDNKPYKFIVHNHRALRVWLLETKDKIEGFSKIYKHNLVDVVGDFDAFMLDLLESSKLNLSLPTKISCICKLYAMDRMRLVETVKPFKSDLPKHSIERDKQAVAYHYDTSNQLFELILSENMLYTSGLFHDCDDSNLDQACVNKLTYAISVMDVQEDHKVLDVGCGWGGFIHECSKITERVEGITISNSQVEYFKNKHEHMSDKIIFLHYKELTTHDYDRVFAFQSTEHMPYDELSLFFKKMYSILKPGGKLLIEFMTTVKAAKCHPFSDKFIFPDGAQFPLATPIEIAEKCRFKLKSVRTLDTDYFKTIKLWVANMEKHKDTLRGLVGDEKYKIFELYLKWAQFSYKSGRSRCYICVWEK